MHVEMNGKETDRAGRNFLDILIDHQPTNEASPLAICASSPDGQSAYEHAEHIHFPAVNRGFLMWFTTLFVIVCYSINGIEAKQIRLFGLGGIKMNKKETSYNKLHKRSK